MGRILNGILGGVSGKVSGVVGGNWKGINYIRSYAKPSNPQTDAQVTQRSKFSSALIFAKSLKGTIIPDYWANLFPNMSAFNAFMKRNIALISGTFKVNANNVIAEGTLEGTSTATCTYAPVSGEVSGLFSPEVFSNGLPTDSFDVVIFDTIRNYSHVFQNNGTRTQAFFTVMIPAELTEAETLVGFIVFHRLQDNSVICSNSQGFVLTLT